MKSCRLGSSFDLLLFCAVITCHALCCVLCCVVVQGQRKCYLYPRLPQVLKTQCAPPPTPSPTLVSVQALVRMPVLPLPVGLSVPKTQTVGGPWVLLEPTCRDGPSCLKQIVYHFQYIEGKLSPLLQKTKPINFTWLLPRMFIHFLNILYTLF